MNSAVMSVAGLVVTLGVLITVHEFGHFWVARQLGIKVLRFSIGFGKPLWRRRGKVDDTEFVIAVLPLGGYVRMLDEREGEVPESERHRAFNRQPVLSRIAVVIAGPMANFIFAIAAYTIVFMLGVTSLKPLVAAPPVATPAYQAGFVAEDLITAIDDRSVRTWGDATIALLESSMEGEQALITVRDRDGAVRQRSLELGAVSGSGGQRDLMTTLGLQPWSPPLPAVIDRLQEGGAGQRDGLIAGDQIRSVQGLPVSSWQQWAQQVRDRPGLPTAVGILRDGRSMTIAVVPDTVTTADGTVGRIGAYARVPEGLQSSVTVELRYGPLAALWEGGKRTAEMSFFTLRMLWRMVLGKASLDNLSGPISIAQYAGQTASMGLTAFLSFLALISVSLGVLNLLPVPVLDGGHLLFYLIEAIKGGPLSENAQGMAQRVGLTLLLLLMGLAFFNDISRLVVG